mgnify:FL=1
MKKQVYIIIAIVITALFMVSPAYAENERLEMNTEDYGSLKVIENDAVLNDVTKYEDSGKYYENGKFIRYYQCGSLIPYFAKYNNVEPFISEPKAVRERYMLVSGPRFYQYTIANDKVTGGVKTFSQSDQEYIQNYVLNYEYVLNQLPQSPEIKNIYYFELTQPYYHDAIYFETSLGNYVMYREEEGGSIHLFTADEFHEYAQDLFDYAMEHNYDENGDALYGNNVSLDEINPGDYTSLSFRVKTAAKWYHILGGVLLAVVLMSLAALIVVKVRKKHKAQWME